MSPHLIEIEALAKEKSIPTINSFEMIRWVFNKGGYLKELEARGVPIVPTKTIGVQDELYLPDFLKEKKDGVVIKPSIAAKAFGLFFVRKIDETQFEVSVPCEKTKDEFPHLKKQILSAKELQDYFQKYLYFHRNNETNKDQLILVQDYIEEKMEYSAVKVRGWPVYFIKRPVGENTNIAHAHFGGQDIYVHSPDNELKFFFQEVMEKLPDNIKDETIFRVDILNCPDKNLLLEIETASPRLFNTPELANNYYEYATTLAVVAKNSFLIFKEMNDRRTAIKKTLAPSLQVLPEILRNYILP